MTHLKCQLHGKRVHLIDKSITEMGDQQVLHRENLAPCQSELVLFKGVTWTPRQIQIGLHRVSADLNQRSITVPDEVKEAVAAREEAKPKVPRRERKRQRHVKDKS
jgi:hypothetical protein